MTLEDNQIWFTQRYFLRIFICHVPCYGDHKEIEKSYFLNTYNFIGQLFIIFLILKSGKEKFKTNMQMLKRLYKHMVWIQFNYSYKLKI